MLTVENQQDFTDRTSTEAIVKFFWLQCCKNRAP